MAITALRGIEVLEILAGMRQPAGLRPIADRTALSESQVFRILQALADSGYVDHLGRAGYRVAARSVAMATLIGPRPALLRAVFPVITRLANLTGEAAVVHLRSGNSRVLILGAPAPNGPILDPAGVLGERSPLAAGASGRIILAYLSEADLASVDLGNLTIDRLAEIRERGYEMSFGENHPGINGVSAPLLAPDHDRGDELVALGSITIAGPGGRMSALALARLAGPLLAASRDLSPKLASILGSSLGASTEPLDI